MSRLGEAITLMKSAQIRHVPIVNEQGQIEGLLGDREILMVLPEPKPRLEVHRELPEAFRERLFEVDKEDLVLTKMVKDVMNRKPQIVKCSSKIVEAAKTMIENKASCLLAAAEDGRLAGILTTGDYMKAIGVFGQFLKD
jgi:predicted transcriptional regulator